MADFYSLLNDYMARIKIKKNDLSKKLGISSAYIIGLTNKVFKPPGFDRCTQIADILTLTKTERIEFLTAAWHAKFNEDDKQFFNAYSDLLRTAGLEAYGPLFRDPNVAELIVTPTMGELLTELGELPENLREVALKTAITTAKGLKGV